MDKIIIETNNDMQKVIDWSKQSSNDLVNIPFEKAEIDFKEEDLLLRFRHIKDSIIFFECETNGIKIAEVKGI